MGIVEDEDLFDRRILAGDPKPQQSHSRGKQEHRIGTIGVLWNQTFRDPGILP